MSANLSTASITDVPHAPTGPAFPRRAAAVMLFTLLIAALVARTAFLIWEPPFAGSINYDDVAPLGSTYWTMHIYVSGPAFAITWIALAIFVALLARGRTAAVTLVGSVLVGMGGLVFALVTTAEALPFFFAADPAAFGEQEGRDIFEALNAQLGVLYPTILGSQAMIAVGVLIALVVSLITRAMPRWFSIAGLVYLVAFVALPFELMPRGATIASDLAQSLLVAGIGWFSLRSVLRRNA